MFHLNQAHADKARLKAQATTLLNAALLSGNDLKGEQLKQYDATIVELDKVQASIEKHLEGAHMSPDVRDHAESPVVVGGMRVAPRTQNAHSSRTGETAGLREVYARATREQREEMDGIAAYFRGDRHIAANANLTPGSDGGVLLPRYVSTAIERDYAQFAPVIGVARIWGTETGEDAVFPVLSDSETAVQLDPAAATGADATVSGDTPPTSLTGPTLKSYKISSQPVFVPRETFTDSTPDILNEIVGALLARIIRFENARYTVGTGSGQAQGLVTAATKYAAGSVALDLDVALDLAYSVPPLYRSNGAYMISDTTAKYLRKLKTGLSGDKRQLWADADATKGTPATLHGYPVCINNDMASVASDGTFAGVIPMLFGDYSKFLVRQAEQGSPFAYRYPVPAKDGAGVVLFRRSDSRLLVPTAVNKLAVS